MKATRIPKRLIYPKWSCLPILGKKTPRRRTVKARALRISSGAIMLKLI
jgi:hypothetical protein